MKLPFLLLALCCYVCSSCQSIAVSANVINEDGAAVSGATITVKGTNKKAVADQNGLFTIDHVQLKDTIIVSAVGYESQIVFVSRLPRPAYVFNIILKRSSKLLNEVIINTGYQSLNKERVTGSFEKIDNAALNLQSSVDILGRLEGQSSLLFDKNSARPAITLRGLSTINSPKDLLIIVDDFPYEGSLANINPADVESVTILKDAAAASVWGARAGNGVVVITTKKAKFNQPLRVSFISNFTVAQKPDLFSLNWISSADYIEMEKFLFSNSYRFSDTSNINRPAFTPVYEILLKQRNGQLSQADANAQIDALKKIDVRNDMEKYLYRSAFSSQYAITLTGGARSISYSFTGGYDDNISEVYANYRRFSLRSNTLLSPVKNLQISVTVELSQGKSMGGRSGYKGITYNGSSLYPYAQLANEKGIPLSIVKDLRQPYKDTAGAGKLLNWNYYPLDDYNHVKATTIINHMIANIDIRYHLLKDWDLSLKYQYEGQQSSGDILSDVNSYSTRDIINRFSQLNRSTGIVKYIVPYGDILYRSEANTSSQNARAQFTYNKPWNKNNIVWLGGAEAREIKYNSNNNTVYGYDHDHLSVSNVDFVNTYPSFLNGAPYMISSGLSFSQKTNRFLSAYSNAAFTFLNKYTLSTSLRKDASNLFGVNTNDKWNLLWSAGAAWNIAAENFYTIKWLPVLKLRTTIGYSGNVDQSKSAVTTLRYSAITAPGTNFPFAIPSQFPNPDLRWEKVRMINLGIDFELTHQVISGSIEYFNKKAKDLLGAAPLDQTTGLGSLVLTKNVASMKGNGVEVNIITKNIDRSFKWNTQLLFTYYKDRITSYYLTTTAGSNYISSGNVITPLVGKPVYSILSYPWAGLDPANGNPRGIINGQVSSDYSLLTGSQFQVANLIYGGPALPPFYGSIINAFGWKNFLLSVCTIYKFGNYFRKESLNYTQLFTYGTGYFDFASRWKNPGDEKFTNVPSMIYPAAGLRDAFYTQSEALVEKAGLVRLKFINLAYNFSSDLVKKWKLQNIQLYAAANDLGLLWRANKSGIDPEYGNNLSPSRSFTLGCKLNF